MLYGEVRPNGHFRFVNFGHPLPISFWPEYRKFMDIDKSRMAQFVPLGLQIAEDHPDRTRYLSLKFRQRASTSDVAEIIPDEPRRHSFPLHGWSIRRQRCPRPRHKLEAVMRERCLLSAKDICNALLEFAVSKDDSSAQNWRRRSRLMTRHSIHHQESCRCSPTSLFIA